MIKAAILPLGFCLLFANTTVSFAQPSPEQTAINEGLQRQAAHITLRTKLTAAADAAGRRDFTAAANLYDEAWDLIQFIGIASVGPEADETRTGLATVRLELARAAQRRGDLREAKRHVADILRVDPANPVAIQFMAENEKLIHEQRTHMPSPEAEAQVPIIIEEKAKVITLVQDGKLYYEMGKLDEAEATLKQAVKQDPGNQAAYYYLNLIKEARFSEALSKRDVSSRQSLVEIEEAWATPPKRELLPVPNPYARTPSVNTSKGRQGIYSKLERIRLDEVKYDGLNLGEVLNDLNDKAKKRDIDKRGVNFILNPNIDTGAASALHTR